MRKKEVISFRECVNARYQNDLVMNGFATFLVMIVPLIVLFVVSTLSRTDGQYSVLSDYMDKAVVLCLAFEAYVIVIIIYKLYTRLAKHSQRDKIWMMSLIEYARSKGANTDKMRSMLSEVRGKERFVIHPLAVLFLIMTFIFLVWVIMEAVPFISDLGGGNRDIGIMVGNTTLMTVDVVYPAIIGGFVMVMLMMVFVFIPVFIFPHAHEKRQVQFTRHMVNALDAVGIRVMPMTQVVKKVPFILVFPIIMFTGGYGFFFLVFRVFRDMNNHLMNEWVYEAELLEAVESDGAYGFTSEFYDRSPDKLRDGRKHSRMARRFSKRMKQMVREENRLPAILLLAELFLLVLLGNYMLKLIALGCMISDEIDIYMFTLDTIRDLPRDALVNVALILMDLFFIITMIDSILGIASRRASSWRKVVRSCFTFVIPLWLSAFVTNASGMSHLFDFNVFITTAILYDMLLMMIVSYDIRRFYTPAGYEMPRIRTWIRYAVWGKIVAAVAANAAAFAEDAFSGVEVSGAAGGSSKDGLDYGKLKKKRKRRSEP